MFNHVSNVFLIFCTFSHFLLLESVLHDNYSDLKKTETCKDTEDEHYCKQAIEKCESSCHQYNVTKFETKGEFSL